MDKAVADGKFGGWGDGGADNATGGMAEELKAAKKHCLQYGSRVAAQKVRLEIL